MDIRDLAEIGSPVHAQSLNPAYGSFHFSFDGVPERDRPAMFRDFLGREIIKYDLVYDLMALAVGATRDASEAMECPGVRAARLQALKDDIAKNIDQPDLSVSSLARRHRYTPRCVQRLFEMEATTFTEYVLEQRLLRAHRILTDPKRASEKISVVAWDSGFGDVSYFNRAFRRRYGLAPSDVRDEARRNMLTYR